MQKLHKHLHNFFVPHEGNDHLPHSVRHKNLWTYSGLLVGLKALLVVLLFVIFPTVAEFSTITQSRITELVNQARVANGLGTVTINPSLQKAAELKLADMIANGYFAHNSPEGIVPWTWFKEAGYLYTYAGENLAMNFTEAEDAHEAWLASPTHRANILNNNYQEIGVAVGVAEIDGAPATLVVQLFGTSFVPPVIAEQQAPRVVQGEESVAKTQVPELAVPDLPAVEIEKPKLVQLPEPTESPVKVEAPLPDKPQAVTRDITGGSESVVLTSPDDPDAIGWILRFVKDFYWLILGLVIVSLLLKIFIQAQIQHKKIIAHGALVIAIGFLLLSLHLHFLEQISGSIIVF